jgi:hypothetical protein
MEAFLKALGCHLTSVALLLSIPLAARADELITSAAEVRAL